jgi:hypothetical protein
MAPTLTQKKNSVMSNFFKSNRNSQDSSPLVILLKPKSIPLFEVSLSGNKVGSNIDLKHNKFCNVITSYLCYSKGRERGAPT